MNWRAETSERPVIPAISRGPRRISSALGPVLPACSHPAGSTSSSAEPLGSEPGWMGGLRGGVGGPGGRGGPSRGEAGVCDVTGCPVMSRDTAPLRRLAWRSRSAVRRCVRASDVAWARASSSTTRCSSSGARPERARSAIRLWSDMVKPCRKLRQIIAGCTQLIDSLDFRAYPLYVGRTLLALEPIMCSSLFTP